ncbi:MAG: hypothetical protein H8D96_03045 [Desulfobacterales bacterium]|uniref:Uncharacterized protein n=1 Tax=Candidatus Desulfatibia vada TaxID=2841696 RepID=A0A8J6P124_9BACT|nr:hypothetical protein [Candidatus Desulfatibia vada]MBL6971223.1 hypothetical protein [Desulfobacterales bacterium]
MKKICTILVLLLVLFASQAGFGEKNAKDMFYLQSEIQTILSGLSDNLNRFEHLQKLLESTGKENKSYDEHKNIWLSTILAIQAISSICEYEYDLLTLFLDLKEHRRVHYLDVRIKSLETSAQQMAIMTDQIRINHRLMPPDLAELHLYEKLIKNIDSSIDLLKSGKNLILQLKKK